MTGTVHGVNVTAAGNADDRASGTMAGERDRHSHAQTRPAPCTYNATTINPTVASTKATVAAANTQVAISNRRDDSASAANLCSISHTSKMLCAPHDTCGPLVISGTPGDAATAMARTLSAVPQPPTETQDIPPDLRKCGRLELEPHPTPLTLDPLSRHLLGRPIRRAAGWNFLITAPLGRNVTNCSPSARIRGWTTSARAGRENPRPQSDARSDRGGGA